MMRNFEYVRPDSLDEVLRHLDSAGARVHGGGTDLLGCLRDGVLSAEKVVSLSRLTELTKIRELPQGGLGIGALVTLSEVASHPIILERYRALARGAAAAASPQLRNQGTIAGNLCQRPRCWYFRGDFDCLRKGGDLCYAVDGENEYHAIFGGSACHIVHPSDTASPLLALGGRVKIAGPGGSRVVDLEDFFVLPAEDLHRENILEDGEIITEVILPPAAAGLRSEYRKVRTRGAWDFALAGVALALRLADGRVHEGRIVLSGVAPMPWRCPDAEEVLLEQPLNAEVVARAATAAVKGATPLDHNAYKVDLVRGLVEATLLSMS